MSEVNSTQAALSRAIDLVVAVPVVVLLSPFLAARGMTALMLRGVVFERTPLYGRHVRRFMRRDFAGPWVGRSLARWLDVIAGDLSVGGPAAADPEDLERWTRVLPTRFAVRPGLVTVDWARRQVGMAGSTRMDAERDFVSGYGTFSSLGLAVRGTLARLLAGPALESTSRRLSLLGVAIDNTTMGEAVRWIIGRAEAGQSARISFANPDCLNIATRNPQYRRALADADRVFADGIGIRIAARLTGQRMADNVNGTDLFPLLCDAAARTGLSLYLLGGRPGVATSAAQWAAARFPGLVIAGSRDGYFDAGEEDRVVDDINRSGASLLLVGLGAPRQDLWLRSAGDRLAVPVRLGVGGLFDYYSGRIPRAPAWLREVGLEWVWRMGCEPHRLWRRYLVGNPLFLARVVLQRLGTADPGDTARAIALEGQLSRRAATVWLAAASRLRVARQAGSRGLKRTLDTMAAGVGIVLLSPVLLGVALAIKAESRGPVIFRQRRVGRDGREFMMFKFRSMFVDAEQRLEALMASNEMAGGVIFKMRDDPRVTRVGRFIRRTSIDELPQLFNVLRGDMSLVGPRPPLPREVELYSFHDRGRLGAAPGITCIWQVSGRSEIPFERQVEMDLDYIDRQSLAEDLKLLVRTVPALLFGRGAY